jgi:hypothetical protein
MDKIQETLSQAKTYLESKEFNEGLAVLENLPEDIPQIELIRQELEQAKIKEIDSILEKVETAREQKDWKLAFDLIREAQALDSEDNKVRAAVDLLQKAFIADQHKEDANKKKQSAKILLNRAGKSIEDIDTAIRLLEEVVSIESADLEAEGLLNESQHVRSEFLKSQGKIATLEQAGEFEEALKEIKNLIAQGYTEFEGKNIFEVSAKLEKKAQEFADEKAGKYLKKAEDELEKNPKLAMNYIEMALGLPALQKPRRDALNELKIKVEQTLEKYKQVEGEVKESRILMDQQEYEPAISKLEGALAKIPHYSEAQTYLHLAREGLKNKIIKNTRIVIARVQTGMNKESLKHSKKDLLASIDTLYHLEEKDVDTLRCQCQELLEEINRREELESILERTLKNAKTALENNDLSTAEMEIESLDKKLKNRPEVIEIRTRLTREQDIENALNETKQAFEDNQLDLARQQIRVLKNRTRKNPEVESLYKKIEAAIQLQKGSQAFEQGLLKDAREAFKKVITLEVEYSDDAREYLRKIDELSEQDRKAKQDYKIAQKHYEAKRFKEAYHLLTEIEELPSSLRKNIMELRSTVREKWRKDLTKQIRSRLKANAYDEILTLANDLKKVQHAEDSQLINVTYKNHHIYQAEMAANRQNWTQAYQHWLEAQKCDSTDEAINKGLGTAKKQKIFREAQAAENEQEVIRILEEVIERQTTDLEDIDFKIEERLYRAYLLAEEFPRAMSLAGMRLGLEAKYSQKAKIIKEFAVKLRESKEKFQRGAFPESLDILKNCQDKYLEYPDIIQDLIRRRKDQVIDQLIEEARELEIKGENEVRIISKYQELLRFEPGHRKAKEQYEYLLTRFNRSISDTIHEAHRVQEDENIPPEEVEYLINRIHEMMTIANQDQQTRLKPHLENLTKKSQTLHFLKKKLRQIEVLLGEAKETGDFSPVDQELNEIVNVASHRNRAYRKLVNEIQTAKDKRSKCEDLADEIETEFTALNFPRIEGLVYDLKRLYEDDEFFIQRRRLKFEDTFSNQKIGFAELKEWAKSRRRNLEKLTAWFNGNKMDSRALEEEELQFRKNVENDFNTRKLVQGLQRLVNNYKNGVEGLISPPESPLSQPAEKIVKQAAKSIKEWGEKAKELEEDVQCILTDEEKVKDLVEKAAQLINQGKYAPAAPFVDEGLEISPTHILLRYYRNMINDKLS